MTQPGPSDYRTQQWTTKAEEPSAGLVEQASDTALEIRRHAGSMAEELVAAIKERPYTTLAITAGLAFAMGAVWKLGHRRPPSRLESLLAHLPQLPSRESVLQRWRG